MEQDKKDVLAGFLLGLAGTSAGLFLTPSVRTDVTVLTLNWSLVLPLTAALAYGVRSALAAYLGGLFLLPFALWPADGVLNYANSLFLGIWLVLSARIQTDFRQGRLRFPLLHQTGLNLAYALFFMTAKILMDLVSQSPLTWQSHSMIALKGFLVRLLLVLTASAFLEVNGIRRILGLAATRDRTNHGFLGLGALGCWAGSILIFWWGGRLAGLWDLVSAPPSGALPFEPVYFALISGAFFLGGLNGLFRINSLLRVRMIHLQAQTAALRRFHRALSQDLKEPLISASGFVRLAQEDLKKGDRSKLDHDLEKIRTTLDSAHQLTTSLIHLGEVDSPQDQREELNSLKPLIKEHFARLQSQFSVPESRLVLGEEWLRVAVSKSALEAIVATILENAFRFRSQERPLTLEAGMACREDGNPQFFFQDNGRGLSPPLVKRLNTPEGGSSSGLMLARRLVDLAGGELRLESEGPDKGTTVWLTFSAMELCDRKK